MLGFVSSNPLLKNITEHLVEEGSYEEEALLTNPAAPYCEDVLCVYVCAACHVIVQVVDLRIFQILRNNLLYKYVN